MSKGRDKVRDRNAGAGVAPYPLAILICDQAINEENTNKKTLVGIFDRIYCPKFPWTYYPLTIYIRLIDAEGTYEFRVDYVQIKTDKVLAQGKFSGIKIDNRLSIIEVLLNPPPIAIPEAGQYEFRIWANNRYIGRVGFTAEKKRKEGVKS